MKTRTWLLIGLIVGLGVLASGCGAKLNPNFDKSVSSALDATKGEYKACYEDALTRDREAKGEMDLAIGFKADGKSPADVDVKKTEIKDDDMKKCVVKATKGIKVDQTPGAPVEKRQTLDFRFEK